MTLKQTRDEFKLIINSENDHFTLAYYPTTKEWELFDLNKDPQQLRSVYADPAYATTVTELKAELARLRAQYGATEEFAPVGKAKREKRIAIENQFFTPALKGMFTIKSEKLTLRLCSGQVVKSVPRQARDDK